MIMSIRHGFSFIEIVVAILISSFLSLVLYNSLSQTQRTMRQVTALMDETADFLPFMAQFEKDLSGVFAPAMDPVTTGTDSKKVSVDKKQEEQKLFHATNKSG